MLLTMDGEEEKGWVELVLLQIARCLGVSGDRELGANDRAAGTKVRS